MRGDHEHFKHIYLSTMNHEPSNISNLNHCYHQCDIVTIIGDIITIKCDVGTIKFLYILHLNK